MRQALTLIELIFTMVIVAIAFSVVPKIIFVANKSQQVTLKEDALFLAMTQIGMIVRLPWDQHTIDTDGKILHIGNAAECGYGTGPHGENGYRKGGLLGSRNCLGYDGSSDWDPTSGKESGDYDDIDDFDGNVTTTTRGRVTYHLSTTVTRHEDNKTIRVEVNATAGKLGAFRSTVFYDSMNLGWVQVYRRAW